MGTVEREANIPQQMPENMGFSWAEDHSLLEDREMTIDLSSLVRLKEKKRSAGPRSKFLMRREVWRIMSDAWPV